MPKEALRPRRPAASIPATTIGAAAIMECVLKRRWTATVLRHVAEGVANPVMLSKLEPGLPRSILNQRLRTLQRYGLLARFPSPHAHAPSEYGITQMGRKITQLLDEINRVDREIQAMTPAQRSAPEPKSPNRKIIL